MSLTQSTRGFNIIFVHSSVDDAGLSAAEFRVYSHLARRASGGTAWPAIDTIAKTCRLEEKTVRKAIKELQQRKMVSVRKVKGRPNQYSITSPDEWGIPLPNGTPPKRHPSQTAPEAPPKGHQPHPSQTAPDEGNPLQGNPTKDQRPADAKKAEHKKFMELWHNEYPAYFEHVYEFTGGKDGAAVKRLFANSERTAEQFITLAKEAWKRRNLPDCFWCRQHSASIASFISKLPEIEAEVARTNIKPTTRKDHEQF